MNKTMEHRIPTLEQFRQAVVEGWVREYKHNTLPLIGFVYSFECEMQNHWDSITKYARGIVFDTSGNLIAFPFPKFFNLNQHEETKLENLPNLPFTVTTKEDGSLIIVFHYQGQWICSTKGSFHSEQANWANNFLKNMKYGWNSLSYLGENNTYLFEGIYPENRIVVDYNGFSGFKFIGAFSRYFKKEMTDDIFPFISSFFPFTKTHNLTLEEIIEVCNTSLKGIEQEGFVLRYDNGLRVKIKGEDYKNIHRVVTNATPLSVWETFNYNLPIFDKNFNGEKPAYLLAIPDEFLPKIVAWDTELRNQYKELLNKGEKALSEAKEYGPERKDICIYLQKNHKDVISLAISLMDNKQDRVHEWIKNRIRPTANQLDSDKRTEILGQ